MQSIQKYPVDDSTKALPGLCSHNLDDPFRMAPMAIFGCLFFLATKSTQLGKCENLHHRIMTILIMKNFFSS